MLVNSNTQTPGSGVKEEEKKAPKKKKKAEKSKAVEKDKEEVKPVKKKKTSEELKPMSFKEKHELSVAINNLDPENLGHVVKIISERMPQLTNSGDEIEIDIDALDTVSLRHLEKYVKSCSNKRRRRRNSQSSPEPLTLEDKQLKVVEAAYATSSTIRELERELATLEGRPLPPPIDVPLPLAKKKTGDKTEKTKEKSKKVSTGNDLLKSESDSESDIDLMSSEEVEKEDLQVVPATVPAFAQGNLKDASQLFSSQNNVTVPTALAPSKKNSENSNVVLKNADHWKLEETNDEKKPSSSEVPPSGESGDLWKKLQTRESINKLRDKEREEVQMKLKLEKERLEREREEKEKELQRQKQEKERKLLEEQQKEKLEQERKREEERLKAQLELEKISPTVNLGIHNEDIEHFERELGGPN